MFSKEPEGLTALLRRVGTPLKVVWLMGKSDLPAVTIPTIMTALALSGRPSLPALLKGLLWNEVHLLAFQVKNQILGIEEDRIAKPHRPLPSGLISLSTAYTLYHCLVVCIWLAALHCNTVLCTALFTLTMIVYNEGGVATIPGLKNLLGAIGIMCFCWGTTITFDGGKQLEGKKAMAVLICGCIFSTTGHAQDFRDRSGDAIMGRKTIPLLLSPLWARWSLAVLIAVWTAGLIALWQPPLIVSVAFIVLGLRTLGGYLASYEEKDDYVSYIYYSFWLLGSNLLPFFSRIRGEFDSNPIGA